MACTNLVHVHAAECHITIRPVRTVYIDVYCRGVYMKAPQLKPRPHLPVNRLPVRTEKKVGKRRPE